MSTPEMNNLNILIIDDEPFIRKLIGRMLYELNIKQVEDAADGAEGLAKVKQSRRGFDVIICDLEMPNMNGFEFVRQLRSDKTNRNSGVPVLILTGHSDEDHIQKSLNLGIQGFLTKPVSKTNLKKRIMSAIKKPAIDPTTLNRG